MTPKEHKLMIGVLLAQLQLFKALLEILNSRGLIETDDVAAFLALIQSQQDVSETLARDVIGLYQTVAKHVGVVTGLESE